MSRKNEIDSGLDYAAIETWIVAGAAIHTVCAGLGITSKKWYSLIKRDEQLKKAYTQGMFRRDMNLNIRLSESRSPHVLIFRAKAVLGMREQPTQLELSGPGGQPIKSEVKTDNGSAIAEASALLDRLTNAARSRPDGENALVVHEPGETSSS